MSIKSRWSCELGAGREIHGPRYRRTAHLRPAVESGLLSGSDFYRSARVAGVRVVAQKGGVYSLTAGNSPELLPGKLRTLSQLGRSESIDSLKSIDIYGYLILGIPVGDAKKKALEISLQRHLITVALQWACGIQLVDAEARRVDCRRLAGTAVRMQSVAALRILRRFEHDTEIRITTLVSCDRHPRG